MMTATEIALADQLIAQGFSYWQGIEAQKNAGTLTPGDLADAMGKLDTDIAQLQRDIAAQAAARTPAAG